MNERDKNYIGRIKKELSFIKSSLFGKEKERFLEDDVLQRAICMSFITIGECANHLSEKFKKEYSYIEWVQIIAVRNIAAHGYWQLDMEQIWQAVIEDIPKLEMVFDKY